MMDDEMMKIHGCYQEDDSSEHSELDEFYEKHKPDPIPLEEIRKNLVIINAKENESGGNFNNKKYKADNNDSSSSNEDKYSPQSNSLSFENHASSSELTNEAISTLTFYNSKIAVANTLDHNCHSEVNKECIRKYPGDLLDLRKPHKESIQNINNYTPKDITEKPQTKIEHSNNVINPTFVSKERKKNNESTVKKSILSSDNKPIIEQKDMMPIPDAKVFSAKRGGKKKKKAHRNFETKNRGTAEILKKSQIDIDVTDIHTNKKNIRERSHLSKDHACRISVPVHEETVEKLRIMKNMTTNNKNVSEQLQISTCSSGLINTPIGTVPEKQEKIPQGISHSRSAFEEQNMFTAKSSLSKNKQITTVKDKKIMKKTDQSLFNFPSTSQTTSASITEKSQKNDHYTPVITDVRRETINNDLWLREEQSFSTPISKRNQEKTSVNFKHQQRNRGYYEESSIPITSAPQNYTINTCVLDNSQIRNYTAPEIQSQTTSENESCWCCGFCMPACFG